MFYLNGNKSTEGKVCVLREQGSEKSRTAIKKLYNTDKVF